jgi:hypothetical protein
MKTRVGLMLAVVGGAATMVAAQAQTTPAVTVAYTLAWSEVSATAPYAPVLAPDGILQPGEAARFTFSGSMSPSGTLSFPSSILVGSSGTGTLGGFWNGNLNILGDAGAASAAGSWVLAANPSPPSNPNRIGIVPPFAVGGGNGTANANGSGATDIQPAQFGGDTSTLNSANPTPTMWRGVWIPNDYTARTAHFDLSNGSLGLGSSVWLFDSNPNFTLPVAARALSSYGNGVNVPIIPAPSSLALLGLGGLVAARRRR